MDIGGGALNPNLIVFGIVAFLAALAAVGVVAFPNAVRSALCLVVNFLLMAVAYFTLNAEVIGITQVIVYTGAIMVLFLFVIMLLNLRAPMVLNERHDWKKPIGLLFGVALFLLVGSQVFPALAHVTKITAPDNYGAPESIGRTLFTLYFFPFEAVSVLLLVGIVGSIMLAKRKI